MSHLTDEQIAVLQDTAEKNDGKCDHCGRTIKIYTYKVNESIVRVLRAMAEETNRTGDRKVDLRKLDIPYSDHTQMTKMRLHGLIAKYLENGTQVASTWVITTKGWGFLAGKEIAAAVIVFDNQVLGHSSVLTDIKRIAKDDLVYEDKTITTAEAGVYHDVRNPMPDKEYWATYKGVTTGAVEHGTVYMVRMQKLQISKPIVISRPFDATYQDLAAFQAQWQIMKEKK